MPAITPDHRTMGRKGAAESGASIISRKAPTTTARTRGHSWWRTDSTRMKMKQAAGEP